LSLDAWNKRQSDPVTLDYTNPVFCIAPLPLSNCCGELSLKRLNFRQRRQPVERAADFGALRMRANGTSLFYAPLDRRLRRWPEIYRHIKYTEPSRTSLPFLDFLPRLPRTARMRESNATLSADVKPFSVHCGGGHRSARPHALRDSNVTAKMHRIDTVLVLTLFPFSVARSDE
jgi:hypothetical protein